MEFNFHVDLRREEDGRYSAEVTVYGGDTLPQEPVETIMTGSYNWKHQAIDRAASLMINHMMDKAEEASS